MRIMGGAGRLVGSRRGRGIVYQLALIAALVAAGWWFIDNTTANLARQNIATGFGFLNTETGFDINQKLIAYDEGSSYWRLLLVGLLNTALVSVLGIALATLLGFFIGVMRLSGNWLVAKLAAVYIEIFRNLPLLLQILFWYTLLITSLPRPRQSFDFGGMVFLNNRGLYLPWLEVGPGGTALLVLVGLFLVGFVTLLQYSRKAREKTGNELNIIGKYLFISVIIFGFALLFSGLPFSLDQPQLKGFNFRGGVSLIPELVALLLALTLYTAAFIAEIVRAGILSVSQGQFEAARALGLPTGTALRLVIIPQALRVIIPPLTSQFLNLTKNSSLAAAIAYPELVSVFAGTALNQTGQAVEIIFITMTIYLALSLMTSLGMNYYNARIALTER